MHISDDIILCCLQSIATISFSTISRSYFKILFRTIGRNTYTLTYIVRDGPGLLYKNIPFVELGAAG